MNTRLSAAMIAASFALLGGIFALPIPALANQYSWPSSSTMTSSSNMSSTNSNMMANGNMSNTMTSGFMGNLSMIGFNNTGMMFGIISSIQNEDGKPAWITTGHWMLTNNTGISNGTGVGTNITGFFAAFYMTKLDGSTQHTHDIYNFTQDGKSTTDGNTTTVEGTSTVTMKDGPVNDVKTEIKLSNDKVFAIELDSDATNNHFGDTPIYGITITPEILHHVLCLMKGTNPALMMMGNSSGMTMNSMTGNMGNMTGMMGDHCSRMNGNTTTTMTGEMRK